MARRGWEVVTPSTGGQLLQHGESQMRRMQSERWDKWRADVVRWQDKQQKKKQKGAMIGGLLGLGLGFGIASALGGVAGAAGGAVGSGIGGAGAAIGGAGAGAGASMLTKLGGAQFGLAAGRGIGGLW